MHKSVEIEGRQNVYSYFNWYQTLTVVCVRLTRKLLADSAYFNYISAAKAQDSFLQLALLQPINGLSGYKQNRIGVIHWKGKINVN